MHRAAVALLLSFVAHAADAGAPRRPFPQHVRYAQGTIRPDHRTQAQQDADVRAFYEHWKAAYVVSAGDGLRRVTFGRRNPGRTVSEGQGYGMMIVAWMAGHDAEAQQVFDGMWRFTRMYPSACDPRLMAWQIPTDEGGSDSAFDGDADIAYALLLADVQWGSRGAIDYRREAKNVIAAILESTIGPDSRLPMLGDWIPPGGAVRNQYTPRSSDFLPGHFRAYRWVSGDRVWNDVVRESQRVIGILQKEHALLPDFIVDAKDAPKPAPPGFLEGPHDGHYYYNAGRVPWRLGTDALFYGDAVSVGQARMMAEWVFKATGGDALDIRAGYALDGSPLPRSDYFTSFFAAPFGVAAMTLPGRQQWLNSIYDSVRARHEDYYEDSVTMLSLLVMTGNAWSPESRRRPTFRRAPGPPRR